MAKKTTNIKMMILAALFAALTAVGAFIQVPLGFSSITLQTLFVLMSALLLGPKWAMLSQLVYVLLGIIGLPIFTQGGGIGYFLKPSMGFLLSYIPAAFIAGIIARDAVNKKNGIIFAVLAVLAGEIIMYLVGTPYMGAILNLYMGKSLSVREIVRMGCLIYLPGDAVKAVVLLIIYYPIVNALKKAKVI